MIDLLLIVLKKKFLRFLIVSCIATVFNFSVFYALHKFLHVDYRIASGTGFMSGVILGYYLNSRWTFKDSDATNPKRVIIKYYAVYLFSLAVNVLMMELLVAHFNIYPSLSNIITIGVTFISNYIGTRFWVFRKTTSKLSSEDPLFESHS